MMPDGFLAQIAPELILLIGAFAVLMLAIVRSPAVQSASRYLSFLIVLVALLVSWQSGPPTEPVAAIGLVVTSLAWYVRLIALSVGLLVLLVNWHLPRGEERADVFSMILFSLSGILLTALADDLVFLFLSIELVSVPTYVLVSISRGDIRAQEAGVKYFFLGALSAALLVYGFSFLYGAFGTTSLTAMTAALNESGSLPGYAIVGALLAFAGIAYKIAAVPFHVYAADVYQGAASPITGLLGFFPKLSGFVALIKLLMIHSSPMGMPGWNMAPAVFLFLWVAAVATMTIGNVLGLMQTNVKRILAYSSIAHSGYMLMALLVGPSLVGGPLRDGLSAMLFYIVVYGVMNLGAFAVLAMIQSRGRAAEALDDVAGLAQQQPLAALALAICLFSLMGMPPTAGFLGKLYIFSSAFSAGPEHPHQLALIVLAVIGLINSAIAAAYYLRIIAACYLREPEAAAETIPRSGALATGILCCCLTILLLGIWPRGLIQLSRQPTYATRQPAAAAFVAPSLDEVRVSESDLAAGRELEPTK